MDAHPVTGGGRPEGKTLSTHIIPASTSSEKPTNPRKPIYRLIPGFLRYRAGDDGSVWSITSGIWRRLKPYKTGKRRNRLKVVLHRDGEKRHWFLHQVVLLAFVGPCPPGLMACHMDDNPQNNNLSNLAYKTHRDNMIDALRNGKIPRGELRWNARLKKEQISAIFELRRVGWTQERIAICFGVAPTTIRKVLTGESWRHVGSPFLSDPLYSPGSRRSGAACLEKRSNTNIKYNT